MTTLLPRKNNLFSLHGMTAAVDEWAYINPFMHFAKFQYAASRLSSKLPNGILDSLNMLKNGLSDKSYVLLHDVPIGKDLPPTPLDSRMSRTKKTYESELMLYAISQIMGSIYAYPEQSSGEIIHNICPVREKSNSSTGESSIEALAFHNDGAAHAVPPDFVVLLCIRSRPPIPHTMISNLKCIIKGMPPEMLEILNEPRFKIEDDIELKFVNHRTKISRILDVKDGNLCRVYYDRDHIEALDIISSAALTELTRLIELEAKPIFLQQGDLLVIDNRVSVHSRSSFSPLYDGCDRWLQSTYVKEEIPSEHIFNLKLSPECTSLS